MTSLDGGLVLDHVKRFSYKGSTFLGGAYQNILVE